MKGERARSTVEGTRFSVEVVGETGSTNDDVLALARDGAPEGIVVVADRQTAGRGRLGRRWEAPAGSSLLMSILLRPPLDPRQAHLAVTAVARAAADACGALGVPARLKWPNDLVVAPTHGEPRGPGLPGGKLGGILAESIIDGDVLEAVVVGLGLNVNWPEELPDDIRDVAVSMNHVLGHEVAGQALLADLLRRLEPWCDALVTADGRARLVAAYRDTCSTIGAEVRIETSDERFEGRALDITEDGHLLVRDGAGAIREVTVGDVVHLRLAPGTADEGSG